MFHKLLAATLAVLLAPVTALPGDYPPVDVEMPIVQVSEHAWFARGAAGMATDNAGFISNAGFVVTDAGVVVFDALGSPSLAWKLRQKIREITDQPVVKVVVSHYHADHIYGLQVFKAEGAEIVGPRGAYEYLESPEAAERLEERRFSLDPWVNEATRLVPPDRMIDDVHRFSLGGLDFQLNYLGSAHSRGDLTMYLVQDRVLYSGDIIFEGRIPWVGDADTARWVETLQRLETNELVALIPGHGGAASDPLEAVAGTRRYLEYLRESMGNAVDDLQDFATAYAETDWSRYADMPAFEAAHRRNAYQVFLSLEAEALGD